MKADTLPEEWFGKEIPKPTMENRLAASQYLADRKLLGGTPEDVTFRVAVELARWRHACDVLGETYGAEIARLRDKVASQAGLINALTNDNDDWIEHSNFMEEQIEHLAFENERLTEALEDMTELATNAMNMVQEMAHWEDVFNGE